jgi:hypothetical protein
MLALILSVLLHGCNEFGLIGIFLPYRCQQPLEADVSLVLIVEVD